jgi:hypothetical protein
MNKRIIFMAGLIYMFFSSHLIIGMDKKSNPVKSESKLAISIKILKDKLKDFLDGLNPKKNLKSSSDSDDNDDGDDKSNRLARIFSFVSREERFVQKERILMLPCGHSFILYDENMKVDENEFFSFISNQKKLFPGNCENIAAVESFFYYKNARNLIPTACLQNDLLGCPLCSDKMIIAYSQIELYTQTS